MKKGKLSVGTRVKITGSGKHLEGVLGTVIKVVIPDVAYQVSIDKTVIFDSCTGTFEPEKLIVIKGE